MFSKIHRKKLILREDSIKIKKWWASRILYENNSNHVIILPASSDSLIPQKKLLKDYEGFVLTSMGVRVISPHPVLVDPSVAPHSPLPVFTGSKTAFTPEYRAAVDLVFNTYLYSELKKGKLHLHDSSNYSFLWWLYALYVPFYILLFSFLGYSWFMHYIGWF